MNILNPLGSFRAKVTLVLILALLLVTGLSNFFIYRFSFDMQFEQLRDKLKVIAQTAALAVDAEMLQRIPLERSGVESPAHKAILKKLKAIKEANQPIRYIYTMAKTERTGVWQFIVDADPAVFRGKNLAEAVTSYPGDRYDAFRFPEMMKAFDEPSADTRIEVDEWGPGLSGYAPIRDQDGRGVAMLGVDIRAEDVFRLQREVRRRGLMVLGLGIIFSLGLGIIISEGIIRPIDKLVIGTRRIAQGDLQYQVKLGGSDEIAELACAFNEMSDSLYESRKKLHNYFYSAMQSLVRLLEARDVYTRGHSDRVAEYAEKIAVSLGLGPQKVEVVKEMALLHDIGKLVISREILDKESLLTEEEWKVIREHPSLGEHILEPIVLDKDMLKIVRSHHERYDGTGYPDGLGRDEIDILVQIVTAADAYDAITSDRAYRPAKSREEAIRILQEGAGTQFNPQIIQAFIKIL